MILEFTTAAVSDLQSIRNYTLQAWGAEQEQRYLDALWKKFEIMRSVAAKMDPNGCALSQISNR